MLQSLTQAKLMGSPQTDSKQHVIALERANKASAHGDRAKAEAQLAEAMHLIAEQEDTNVHLIYERLCKKQKAAFIAAEVAAKRLVQRARYKAVLTTAAKVAKQKQRRRRQHQELTIAAAKVVGKRQQTEQKVVEADMPATRAPGQPQEAANTAPAE